MNLVDEEERTFPGLATSAGSVEHLFEIADAGENRRDLLEMQIGRLRQKPRDRSLTSAGRSPENQRAERACIEEARERAVRPEQMILPDDLGEPCRPQLVRQRTRRTALEPRRREEGRAPAPGARHHPRNSTDSC